VLADDDGDGERLRPPGRQRRAVKGRVVSSEVFH
jgi:hypothetical protein